MDTSDRFPTTFLSLALLLALSPGILAADPPGLIDYQGVLRNAADEPLTGAYDMTFRFFDAEGGGNEILVDEHLAANAQEVAVDGGMFSVALGGGAVADGSGPGTYASLSSVFHDYPGVWLEVQVGAEVLSPRTRVTAGAYALNATSAENANQLDGHPAGFYLDTSATRQTKGGTLLVESADASNPVVSAIADAGSAGAIYTASSGSWCKLSLVGDGIECHGDTFGGFFHDSTDGSFAYAGYASYGTYASGTNYGGYFTSPNFGGRLRNSSSGAEAYVGGATYGVDVYGPVAGQFTQLGTTGYTKIGYSGYGILTQNHNGVHSYDLDDGSYGIVGSGPYKIRGNGTVSFVQNHPDDATEVLIYHAPESSEVNVYTRGSAKLVDGVARVPLDPTFQWTANPDIGLTAHLTPRGEPVALAVESVTTKDLVVRGPEGSDVAFDYWVTGLRIGFEQMPPVAPKEIESWIPLQASGDDVYGTSPGLRAYNALERYRGMARDLGEAIDPQMSAAADLRARIGIGRPVEPFEPTGEVTAETPRPEAVTRESVVSPAPVREAGPGAVEPAPRTTEVFAATSAIEAAEVVVLDPTVPGAVRRSDSAADRNVVGVAVDADHDGKVEVAYAAIREVLVDATDRPIAIGDLLTTSATVGAAMRAVEATPGTILGKALEPQQSGIGTIRVLLMPR